MNNYNDNDNEWTSLRSGVIYLSSSLDFDTFRKERRAFDRISGF